MLNFLDSLELEDRELICLEDIKDIKFEIEQLRKERLAYRDLINSLWYCRSDDNGFRLSYDDNRLVDQTITVYTYKQYKRTQSGFFYENCDEIIKIIDNAGGWLNNVNTMKKELEEKINQKVKLLKEYEKKRDLGLFYYRYVPDKVYDYSRVNKLIKEIDNNKDVFHELRKGIENSKKKDEKLSENYKSRLYDLHHEIENKNKVVVSISANRGITTMYPDGSSVSLLGEDVIVASSPVKSKTIKMPVGTLPIQPAIEISDGDFWSVGGIDIDNTPSNQTKKDKKIRDFIKKDSELKKALANTGLTEEDFCGMVKDNEILLASESIYGIQKV